MPPSSAKSLSSPRIQWMPWGSRPLAGSSRMRDLRITEQGVRDAQSLAHPERVVAQPAPGLVGGQSDEVQDLVDAVLAEAHEHGAEGEHLAARPAGVLGGGVEEHADLPTGVGQLGVGLAEDRGGARGGRGESGHHAHRGGLPGAVRAKEARHRSGGESEGDVVDGGEGSVTLGEVLDCDHVDHRVVATPCCTSVGGLDRVNQSRG